MSTEGGREVLGMQFANHHSLTSSQGNHATQVADQASVPMGIRQSIIANPSNAVAQVEGLGSEASKDQKPISKYRISIDDRIYSMATQRAPELPVVHDPHGDTYVFIDPSRKQPEQDESDYAQYIKRYQGPALMNKDTLTKYSPYLAKAFSPSAQFRTLRRRKLLKGLPPNVKYVIDLTPPSEGDEAVYLTTLLSCSEGVRLWYQSSQIWNVSELLVKGEDEHSSFKSPKAVSVSIQKLRMCLLSVGRHNLSALTTRSRLKSNQINNAIIARPIGPLRY